MHDKREQIVSYLSQYKEETPLWLENYTEGNNVSFSDIMSSRIGYYPGSGYDGTLIKVGNMSHTVHSFLYVDYWLKKVDLINHLKQPNSISGYHCIGRIEWTQKDIMPNGVYPLTVERVPQICEEGMFVNHKEKPYCFTDIMERDADKGDDWGAYRFAITFLFADGIATYYQLFCKEFGKAPWIFLLQDHGFGGNYDLFGKSGILDEIILKSDVRPEFVLCATNTRIWDGYTKIEGVESILGGMHHNPRSLYKIDEIV